MMESLNKLNEKQKEAALHKDGPLLILAGAGSGKTSTMTQRIAHLVKDECVNPWEILAVTFTNKAANEMRERVEALVGNTRGMWIMTFHASCLRILHMHADVLGYDRNFTVYDPTDQKIVVKNAVKSLEFDEKKFTPNYVLSIISSAKNSGKTAAQFEAEASFSALQKQLAEIYTEYERVLQKNNAMDFDDLIMNTVTLFTKHPDVLAEYQGRFTYIMVDEYQDTNQMQYEFIKMLAEKRRNICVVGDDDQCIYEWRGADISNILNFEHDFGGAKVIKLEQNYRSYGNILAGANSVIANNSSRKDKALWTEAEDGEKIQFVEVRDEREEARFVAGEIERGISGGRNYRDFATLYRTNAQSRTFEEAFSSLSIPYQLVGGVRYYDRKEIKDIMSYMRLIVDPNDDVAFTRIINEPRRGVGAKTLAKLTTYAASRGTSLFGLLSDDDVIAGLPAKAGSAMRELVRLLNELRAESGLGDAASGDLDMVHPEVSVEENISIEPVSENTTADILSNENVRINSTLISDIYDQALVKSGYLHELEAAQTVESEGRIENLLEFKSVILEEETAKPNITLTEFMENLALVSDIDNHDRGENAVTLMTLHSAKGLEFPVVFMPGMEEGLFPGSRVMDSIGGIEEERRLCYVGMTRAREKLYLIRAKARTMYGKYDYTLESRFLREIDKDTLEGADKIGRDTTGYLHRAMGAEDGYAEAAVIRPFDQLRKIKGDVHKGSGGNNRGGHFNPEVQPGVNTEYNKGERVRHGKFGEGLVLDADARTVTVMFDTEGKKKLAKDTAPITKI
jgi:DNA helicase-2/ATP-dependent DNA helicase PcrA